MKQKNTKTVGEKLVAAVKEAVENPKSLKVVSRGLDIKHLRKMLDMSQSEFCKAYGFNLDTLKKWEQGAHSPDQAVVSYISCIFKKPKTIANIVKSQPDEDSLACST
ncbi:MAG: helix-turn-helix domain-containing protein [Cyanobacteria bacterium REEB446]|jgi:DNA-binding transcriptional regulator YiaG|nr:helix-turn-helix domain-containing protein [Cyanobacteria bacterium REEB446]